MIALIQRVCEATVSVDDSVMGAIGVGILALIGVRRGDGATDGARLLERILSYRIFPDEAGRMNRSLREVDGGLLLVPQFTLAADTHKGNRAGFQTAAPPEQAVEQFELLLRSAKAAHSKVAAGVFGTHMRVALVNDGPVTFWLEAAAGADA